MSQHNSCRRRRHASSATLLVLLLLWQSAPPGRPSGWTTFCTPSKGALENGLQRTRDWRTCHAAVAATSAVDTRPVGKRLEDIASDFATTADLSAVKQSFEQLVEEGVVLHPSAYKGPLKVCATEGRPEDARSWMAYMAEKEARPPCNKGIGRFLQWLFDAFSPLSRRAPRLLTTSWPRRIGEHTASPDLVIPGLPGMGDLPDEDDPVDQDDEDSEDDSETETPQEEPEEADHSHESPEQHPEEQTPATPTATMPPLPARRPMSTPPTVQSVHPVVVKSNFLYDSVQVLVAMVKSSGQGRSGCDDDGNAGVVGAATDARAAAAAAAAADAADDDDDDDDDDHPCHGDVPATAGVQNDSDADGDDDVVNDDGDDYDDVDMEEEEEKE
eukprot:s2090_g3.t4